MERLAALRFVLRVQGSVPFFFSIDLSPAHALYLPPKQSCISLRIPCALLPIARFVGFSIVHRLSPFGSDLRRFTGLRFASGVTPSLTTDTTLGLRLACRILPCSACASLGRHRMLASKPCDCIRTSYPTGPQFPQHSLRSSSAVISHDLRLSPLHSTFVVSRCFFCDW